MDVPALFESPIAGFDSLGQWDRAELGRSLRRLGLSYGEIMELIPVPKGTLAGWCREIRLSDAQVAAIKARTGSQLGVPRDTQRERRLQVEEIRAEALRTAEHHAKDSFWVAGVVLSWGEGSKTTRRLELANADPRALRLFMAWAGQYLDPRPSFVAALNLHANNDEAAARSFWQEQLGLRPENLTKSYIKPEGTGHRKNHLRNGVCRVRLRRGTDAFVKTTSWIDFLAAQWPVPGRPQPD